MGAMKDLFIKQVEDLGNSKRCRFSADELWDSWWDWADNGWLLTEKQPSKPHSDGFQIKRLRDFEKDNLALQQQYKGVNLHLEEIESLAYSTGYPPNILLAIWLEDLADDDPGWDSFKASTLELDW